MSIVRLPRLIGLLESIFRTSSSRAWPWLKFGESPFKPLFIFFSWLETRINSQKAIILVKRFLARSWKLLREQQSAKTDSKPASHSRLAARWTTAPRTTRPTLETRQFYRFFDRFFLVVTVISSTMTSARLTLELTWMAESSIPRLLSPSIRNTTDFWKPSRSATCFSYRDYCKLRTRRTLVSKMPELTRDWMKLVLLFKKLWKVTRSSSMERPTKVFFNHKINHK